MKKLASLLIFALVFVMVLPVSVFGETVVSPVVEKPNKKQPEEQSSSGEEEKEDEETTECKEFIPPDEQNPDLSPEEKKEAEQSRKKFKDQFVCEEQGEHYQRWVSKDGIVVSYIWTNPLETLRFWTPERLEQAEPMIMSTDELKETNKKFIPKGPPGKIEPQGPIGDK